MLCVRGRQRCCQRNQRRLLIRLEAIVRHALRGRPLHLVVYAILGCSSETAAIQGPAFRGQLRVVAGGLVQGQLGAKVARRYL
jgi:hypothetical protein